MHRKLVGRRNLLLTGYRTVPLSELRQTDSHHLRYLIPKCHLTEQEIDGERIISPPQRLRRKARTRQRQRHGKFCKRTHPGDL